MQNMKKSPRVRNMADFIEHNCAGQHSPEVDNPAAAAGTHTLAEGHILAAVHVYASVAPDTSAVGGHGMPAAAAGNPADNKYV